MSGVVSPPIGQRALPSATIYVGIPAYLVVVGFSLTDFVRWHSSTVSALTVGLVALFTVVFLWLGLRSPAPGAERRIVGAIAAMGILALAIALLGSTSTLYPIAVAAMAGDSLEGPVALPVILLATAGVAGIDVAHGLRFVETVSYSVIGLTIGFFTYGANRLSQTNRQLVEAREELAGLAVANERLRFARDLHDLLGHSLTVIRAKSELASRLAPTEPERAAKEMTEVEDLARQALGEVRETVTGYRRPTLLSEIANARAALRAVGIAADLPSPDSLVIPPEVDEALGWVLREAVTNVVRHSGAQRCRVETVGAAGGARLEVTDDGRGTAPTSGPASGLAGARERLGAVGGTLEVGNAPGGGFRLVAWVPGAT